LGGRKIATESAVAEIFGIGVGIAQIIVDEHRGLPGKLEPFAAFETSDEVVEPHHEGCGLLRSSSPAPRGNSLFFRETFQRTGNSNSPRQLGQTSFIFLVSSFSV
jgi:hypothetical protein